MVRVPAETARSSESFPHAFLSSVGEGRQYVSARKKDTIYAQGDATDALFFIHRGRVKISVVSWGGKEATLGILGECSFIGECGLAGPLPRMSSATAMTDCVLLRIEKRTMLLAIREDPTLASLFVRYLLTRNLRQQEDLANQLFNSSEKRLARLLLSLTEPSQKTDSGIVTPKLTQETLAEMVGTTRPRVSFFLNRFRKLGLIHYDAGDDLHVNNSLRQVIRGVSADSSDRTSSWKDPELLPDETGGLLPKNHLFHETL
jgi:CRP/FNR family transcriptional regulator, cyclic AMP receptor protein